MTDKRQKITKININVNIINLFLTIIIGKNNIFFFIFQEAFELCCYTFTEEIKTLH